MIWSMLPGAQALTPTRVKDVRRVVRTGYVNVHTLRGQHFLLTLSCCGGSCICS